MRLQAEYAAWLDALPQALRGGATGEALQAIVDLDLDELASIEPPRGFGRDRRCSAKPDRGSPTGAHRNPPRRRSLAQPRRSLSARVPPVDSVDDPLRQRHAKSR